MFANKTILSGWLALSVACGSDSNMARTLDADGGGSPGCVGPPAAEFDPIGGYAAPPFVPTVTVTSPNDSGPGSLRDAVAVGGNIGFDSSLTGKVITLVSPIQIEKSVTIDGRAAVALTIDGDNKTSIFRFNGDAQTRIGLFALRLINGKSDGSGGAVSINGGDVDVEIGGVRFESNAASEGGAVRVGYGNKSRVSVHDSTFLNNDGSIGDNGFSGGAISANGAQLTVARCRFEGNKGSTSGAVYAIHANPTIEDSVFIGNRSSRDSGSGAFFVDGGGPGDYGNGIKTPGQINIRRSLFWKNRGAGDDGGAAELYAYPPDVVTVQDSVFRENQSTPGRAGALFIHADNAVNIKRTAFVDNRAEGGPGGAIWADGDGTYEFENVLFSGNVTTSDLGGALRMNVSERAKIRIVHSTLANNTAQSGNGAMWIGGMRDVRVRNSIFVDNSSSASAQQINFAVTDDGGNIEWPDVKPNVRSLGTAIIVDPMLGALLEENMLVRPLPAASPARDRAVSPWPLLDQRGFQRDATPDIGSYELGGECK
jgi:hypothetical protein